MFCFWHLQAQIWYAHPHTTFTCISIALSIAAVLVNWVCILFFSLDLRAQGARWARAKAGSGPKNGLLVLTLRVHASPALSPSLSYMRVRSDSLCFGAGDHGCTCVYIRVHPLHNLLFQRLSIPLQALQTPRRPPHRRHTAASPPHHRLHPQSFPHILTASLTFYPSSNLPRHHLLPPPTFPPPTHPPPTSPPPTAAKYSTASPSYPQTL
jgi:hypothetical protein